VSLRGAVGSLLTIGGVLGSVLAEGRRQVAAVNDQCD